MPENRGVMTSRPAVGVLALQGGVDEHVTALERAGADPRPVRRPEELAAVHGLVLPGGESTTATKLLEAFELTAALRQRLADGMPAYGSCAGMIMLASEVVGDDLRPLGALDVSVRRNAFGRQVDSFEADLEFAGDVVRAVFIRAPWVERVGPDVQALATAPAGPQVQGRTDRAGRIVAVQQGPVLATAFHPELVGGDELVHRHFVQIVRSR